MANGLLIVANVIIFAASASHFGLWVCLPLGLAYSVGFWQALR